MVTFLQCATQVQQEKQKARRRWSKISMSEISRAELLKNVLIYFFIFMHKQVFADYKQNGIQAEWISMIVKLTLLVVTFLEPGFDSSFVDWWQNFKILIVTEHCLTFLDTPLRSRLCYYKDYKSKLFSKKFN